MANIREPSVSHSYFIPMVDMLAGVVFILIIMLAAVSLTSRSSFSEAERMQADIQKIRQELAEARAAEQKYIEPRRLAEKAVRLLLQRLSQTLAEKGVSAEIRPQQGMLIIPADAGFAPGGVTLSDSGRKIANVLAAALGHQLPCLAPGVQKDMSVCTAYPAAARLNRVVIAVNFAGSDGSTETPAQVSAQALGLFSSIARDEPDLLALQATDGDTLFRHTGNKSIVLASTSRPSGEGSTGDKNKPVENGTGRREIQLSFHMNVPALPKP